MPNMKKKFTPYPHPAGFLMFHLSLVTWGGGVGWGGGIAMPTTGVTRYVRCPRYVQPPDTTIAQTTTTAHHTTITPPHTTASNNTRNH